ncbi:MerR family transcriptional regulator [uncultured Alistipes sp.]|jgi:DNA-binding transcriptional MerR regulator|uniref:MerR family transcriptional regulator n=1 Tax=uncultured Alistipes sp. TaxID=538949 RepID=UPI0026DEB174|nr:MerR family transcriptional regulator [uncultured Alistipes sp.]
MAEKLYYSMGEVAEMFDVRPSLLRHWESQFGVLRPKRNKKGNRLFTPADVENLKLIYHLVKEQGMTLEGARKALRQCRREKAVPRDVELLERLQRIRALLVEVREELKGNDSGEGRTVVVDSPAEVAAADLSAADMAGSVTPSETSGDDAPRPRRRAKAVVKFSDAAAGATADGANAEPESGAEAGDGTPAAPKRGARRPRRKKEEAEHKELFAFYEQSLF